MYDAGIWNKLAWLESQDAVGVWHSKIHQRILNTRRRMEITAAARQAREYFAQAASADLAVKPLLTFYGVSCLSRASILLVGKHCGETTLASSHGLQTLGWGKKLDGELPSALKNIGKLGVKTCKGLYMDLVHHTDNMICIHVRSSAVEWQLSYPAPELGAETDFDALITRLPDLKDEVLNIGLPVKFIQVTDLTYNTQEGLKATVQGQIPDNVSSCYAAAGYTFNTDGNQNSISASTDIFAMSPMQFVHRHQNAFIRIPDLHISETLWKGSSPICLIFKTSYILGMLSRYYPTHWMSLVNGAKGDLYRSLLLQSQNLVERIFPELVFELINHKAHLVQKNK